MTPRGPLGASSTSGVRQALRALRAELRTQRVHRGGLRRARSLTRSRNLNLNLGCGANRKDGWINIDLTAAEADLHLDLREPLPFRPGSAAVIYSEHFFEHLEYPGEATRLLHESIRVLAPGGLFSVGVPDAGRIVRAYVLGDEEYYRLGGARLHPEWCDTRMHNLNYTFRQAGEHRYAYDLETLQRVLQSAGFVGVHERDFEPALDSEERRVGTVYVDARRPDPT